MKVGLFLMTKKGFFALENLLLNKYESYISFVCLGNDSMVEEDYSNQIERLCKLNKIKYFFRSQISENKIDADYYIAVSWRWMLEKSNLIVLHDSLLPKYRGFAPLVTMLINGETYLGVTALYASEEYDKGDIIFQEKIAINYPIKILDAIDIVGSLYSKIMINIFEAIINQKLICVKQNEDDATYSLWLDYEDYFIDWGWNAEKIKRKVDACGYPFIGARAYLDNQVIVIREVEIENDVKLEQRIVGKNIFIEDGKPIIVCGVGILKINEAFYEESKKSIFPLNKFRIKFK